MEQVHYEIVKLVFFVGSMAADDMQCACLSGKFHTMFNNPPLQVLHNADESLTGETPKTHIGNIPAL